eukprot:s2111_g3.t4
MNLLPLELSGCVCEAARFNLNLTLSDATSSVRCRAFGEPAEMLADVPASEFAVLENERLTGSIHSEKTYTRIFSNMLRRWSLTLKCRKECFEGRERVQISVENCSPVDFVSEGKEMAAAVEVVTESMPEGHPPIRMRAPSIFGESPLLLGAPARRTATIIAKAICDVRMIHQRIFNQLSHFPSERVVYRKMAKERYGRRRRKKRGVSISSTETKDALLRRDTRPSSVATVLEEPKETLPDLETRKPKPRKGPADVSASPRGESTDLSDLVIPGLRLWLSVLSLAVLASTLAFAMPAEPPQDGAKVSRPLTVRGTRDLASKIYKMEDSQALDFLERWFQGQEDLGGLRKMPPRVRESLRMVINTIIKAAGNEGKLSQSYTWYQRMREAKIDTNPRTFGKLVAAAAKVGFVEDAELWLDSMLEEGFQPDLVAISSVITACCEAKEPLRAERWFQQLLQRGLAPDLIAYNSMIDAHAEAGDGEKAAAWLQKAMDAGIDVSTACYNAVIKGYCRQGDLEGANEWLQKAKAAGRGLDIMSYNTVLNYFAEEGDLKKAQDWFGKLKASGLQLDQVSFNTMIKAAVAADKLPQTEEYIQEMLSNSLQPTSATYVSLVSAYGDQGDLETAQLWYDKAARAKKTNQKMDTALAKAHLKVFTYGGRGPSFRSFRLSGPSRAFLPQIPRTLAMASVKSMIAAGLLAAPCADAFVAPGGSQFSQAVSGLRGSTAVKAESGFSAYSALAVSATTGAAVLSFVGAKKPAARKTVACRFSPEAQIGVTEPLGFFDPAGLAMMGALGMLTQSLVQLPGMEGVPKDISAFSTGAGQTGFLITIAIIAVLEAAVFVQDDSKEPGNFGNPVPLVGDDYSDEMRNREINNGRIVNGAKDAQGAERGLQSFAAPKDGMELNNAVHYTTMINAYAESGDVEGAAGWFRRAREQPQVRLNIWAYNAMIKACGNAKDVERAQQWFNIAQQDGVKPDVYSYTLMISACAKVGRVGEARRWLERMEGTGVKPNVVSYTEAIKAGAISSTNFHPGLREYQLFARMLSEGVWPTVVTYNFLLKSMVRSKPKMVRQAEDVFRHMSQCWKENVLDLVSRFQMGEQQSEAQLSYSDVPGQSCGSGQGQSSLQRARPQGGAEMTGRSHADYEESSHNEASDPVMKMRNLVTKMAVRQKRRETMPNGGRRRADYSYGRWDQSGYWQWTPGTRRRERWASSTGSFNMNRAQQLLGHYRVAGEELYNQAVRVKMPEESFPAMEEYVQEVPCATWNMMDTRMRSADHGMPMYDAIGCGERPYFINVPEAAPPSLPMYDAIGCGERPYFINVPEAAPPSLSTASQDATKALRSVNPQSGSETLASVRLRSPWSHSRPVSRGTPSGTRAAKLDPFSLWAAMRSPPIYCGSASNGDEGVCEDFLRFYTGIFIAMPPKPTCFDLPDAQFSYGRPGNQDQEGAREVSMRWIGHTPSKRNEAEEPDFVSVNRKAAVDRVTNAKDLRQYYRQVPDPPLMSARGHKMAGKPLIPSDVIPEFAYGRKVRPSTPIQEAARADRGVLWKAGGPPEPENGGRDVLPFHGEDGEWVLEPEEMQRAEHLRFEAWHLAWRMPVLQKLSPCFVEGQPGNM